MRNGSNEQEDGTHIVGNPDKPEMLEIIEEPVNNVPPEDVIELGDKIGNLEAENLAAENNEDNYEEIRNNQQEFTGVDSEDDDNNSQTLRRGKRRRIKNPKYFNEKTVLQ